LIAMLARHVETGPDVEAVVEVGGQRLAYQQLWDRAERVAGGLRAAGVARGDRVAVRYPAGVNWVLAFWGTLMAGGVAVAVNTRSSQPEVEFVLQDAGVTVDLAADSPLTVDVQQVLAHCREQLADFKIPQYIVVSGRPLPRNPGGKLLKAQLGKSVEWGAPL
jgi:acyl-CoA synthetase (AMP-forming)/AMP-acid ligase II